MKPQTVECYWQAFSRVIERVGCGPETVASNKRGLIFKVRFDPNMMVTGWQQRNFGVLIRSLLHDTMPAIRERPAGVKGDVALTLGGRMSEIVCSNVFGTFAGWIEVD